MKEWWNIVTEINYASQLFMAVFGSRCHSKIQTEKASWDNKKSQDTPFLVKTSDKRVCWLLFLLTNIWFPSPCYVLSKWCCWQPILNYNLITVIKRDQRDGWLYFPWFLLPSASISSWILTSQGIRVQTSEFCIVHLIFWHFLGGILAWC